MAEKKEKTIRTEEKKESGRSKLFLIIGGGVLAFAVILYLLLHFFILNPNRNAKDAAAAAFDAIYSVDYDSFVKYTVYSDNAQKYLRMETSLHLPQIQQEFTLREGEKDEYKMKTDHVDVKEFGPDDEDYKKGVELLLELNGEAIITDIEKVAIADIYYKATYLDNGEQESGVESFWVFRVHGRWYAHPLLSVMDDGEYVW